MRLEELVSVREIRAVIKERFLEFKDVTDPRVSMHVRQPLAAGLGCTVRSSRSKYARPAAAAVGSGWSGDQCRQPEYWEQCCYLSMCSVCKLEF
jgi:hypothetical protein